MCENYPSKELTHRDIPKTEKFCEIWWKIANCQTCWKLSILLPRDASKKI